MRLALIAALLAAAAATTATEAMQKRDAEIRAALPPIGTEPTEAQRTKAQGLLTEFIDFRGMAEASLGKHWAKMSEAKRKELIDAFTTRFKKATLGQLDFYRSTAIKYEPETKQDDLVMVPTSMVVKGEPTQVTYAMKQAKNGWLIEDIVIDDVSTIQNYRASFNKVISKEGVDGLIAKLNKSTDESARQPEPKKAERGSAAAK